MDGLLDGSLGFVGEESAGASFARRDGSVWTTDKDGMVPALLAAEIIKALDKDGLTVRAAHARTGIAAADFSRIRNADLARFTLDRLMGIINRLGGRVEIKLKVKPVPRTAHEALA